MKSLDWIPQDFFKMTKSLDWIPQDFFYVTKNLDWIPQIFFIIKKSFKIPWNPNPINPPIYLRYMCVQHLARWIDFFWVIR